MLNRSIPPLLKEIQAPNVNPVVRHTLPGDIELIELNMGNQDILKLELIFNAGRWEEKKKLVARTTAQLLKEGTIQRSGAQLAEAIEFYGANLKIADGFNTVSISLFCLTKYFSDLLPLVCEMVTQPFFPESELKKFVTRSKQKMLVDLEQNDTLAYRIFTEAIFGKHHPYGYNSTPELYDTLTIEDVKEHYERCYHANNCTIMLSGKTTDEHVELLEKYTGLFPNGKPSSRFSVKAKPFDTKKIYVKGSNEFQAAIRIGKKSFNKKHPDYNGMYVLNTILGGYFGSRLMLNLREDKGYTYGVYSSLDTMVDDGYFFVNAEVANEVKDDALKEIYYEIERLKTELVSEEELNMVRSYLQGTLLSGLDGVFNVSEVQRDLYLEGLDATLLENLVETIKTIGPEEIQQLAQRHLGLETLYEVVVG